MLYSYFKKENVEYLEIRDSSYSYFAVVCRGTALIESELIYSFKKIYEHYENNKDTIEQMKLSLENDQSILDRLDVVRNRIEYLRNNDLTWLS